MSAGPRPNGLATQGFPVAPAETSIGSAAVEPGEPSARVRVKKAPTAFRTISEVADDLHIPQHVLRFWETKFPQVRPLKRGGGRRYYRPDDIALLKRISGLLYIQGFTIKGVQRLLREGGGRLSDDVPMPREDEQREAPGLEALGELEPPLPGLGLPPPSMREHFSARALAMRSVGGPAGPAGPAETDEAGLAEVGRLRRVLAETLRELEALRALLA